MKVRYNKGPWHRKVADADYRDVERGIINVAVHDSGYTARWTVGGSPDLRTYIAPNIRIATYKVKMVTVDIGGSGQRQIPSVYPDGAICFEYVGSA